MAGRAEVEVGHPPSRLPPGLQGCRPSSQESRRVWSRGDGEGSGPGWSKDGRTGRGL